MTRPMSHPLRATALVLLPLVLAACGAHRGATNAVRSEAGGTILSGAALTDGQGTILDTMRGKVPSLRVRRDGGPCPRISLRNDASFMTQTNPLIYIDGTRTQDTCVLESLQSRDVELVEVYPSGVSNRPGYDMYAHGLILLFLRS